MDIATAGCVASSSLQSSMKKDGLQEQHALLSSA